MTNTDFLLKANTFARGSLVIEKQAPTQVVPLNAVVTFSGITKVFLVDHGVARSRTVSVGRIRDGFQEITEGLQAGEKVIADGNTRLTEGAAVLVGEAAPIAHPANPAAATTPAKGSRENQ